VASQYWAGAPRQDQPSGGTEHPLRLPAVAVRLLASRGLRNPDRVTPIWGSLLARGTGSALQNDLFDPIPGNTMAFQEAFRAAVAERYQRHDRETFLRDFADAGLSRSGPDGAIAGMVPAETTDLERTAIAAWAPTVLRDDVQQPSTFRQVVHRVMRSLLPPSLPADLLSRLEPLMDRDVVLWGLLLGGPLTARQMQLLPAPVYSADQLVARQLANPETGDDGEPGYTASWPAGLTDDQLASLRSWAASIPRAALLAALDR
jgi:hypothetical protein